jgi:hypothetical protein
MRTPVLVLASLLTLTYPLRADGPASDVDSLIVKLGSAKFSERDAATLALDQRGAAALDALGKATQHADPEVRRRAHLLVQRIAHRLEAARALTANKVRLVYDNVLVLDAVKDFAAKTGLPMEVEGDRLGLRGRLIKLDTGEVSFWEAFDQFCRAAGLREKQLPLKAALGVGNPYIVNKPGYVGPPGYLPSGAPPGERIALLDSGAPPLPTSYCGPLRLRAVPPPAKDKAEAALPPPPGTPSSVGFHLDVSAQPTLVGYQAVSLRITKAIDEHGQHLLQPEPYLVEDFGDPLVGSDTVVRVWDGTTGMPMANPSNARQLLARLKPGKLAAKTLKEVQGVLTAEVATKQLLVQVADLHKAAGQDFAGRDGSAVKVLNVQRQGEHLLVRLQVRSPSAAPVAGGGVRVVKAKNRVLIIDGPPPPSATGQFTVTVAKGVAVSPVESGQWVVENNQGGLDLQYQLKFHLPDQCAGPVELRYSGPRLLMVDIPFTLRDVPLVANPQLPPRPGIAQYEW